MTPWLKVLGKGAPEAPMLRISFVRTQDSLRSVSTQVKARPVAQLCNANLAGTCAEAEPKALSASQARHPPACTMPAQAPVAGPLW